MKRSIVSMCMAVGFILFAGNAMAGAQVYFTFGFPVVQFEMDGEYPYEDDFYEEGPYEDDIWIEGHYIIGHPNHIWVPGYWTPVRHNHAVCIHRPHVYRHFHGYAGQGSYRHAPRQFPGHYRRQGNDGYHNPRREGYNRQHNSQQPRNNRQGQGNYNHQNPPQGQYNPVRRESYRSGGNWMNNINNKVIKRQINQTR